MIQTLLPGGRIEHVRSRGGRAPQNFFWCDIWYARIWYWYPIRWLYCHLARILYSAVDSRILWGIGYIHFIRNSCHIMYIYIYINTGYFYFGMLPLPFTLAREGSWGSPAKACWWLVLQGRERPIVYCVYSLVDVVNKMSIRYHVLRRLTTKCDGQHTLVAVRTSSEAFFLSLCLVWFYMVLLWITFSRFSDKVTPAQDGRVQHTDGVG